MKRNKLFMYAMILAFPVFLGGLISCTDSFEDLNTSDIQVDPNELPFAAQCTEPMNYCYPPQQNMFQFWTNLTIDLYSGYFMTPNGNFTNGDLGENRGHSGGMYENYYLHIFNNTRRIIATCDANNEFGLAGVMRIVQAYGTLMTTDAHGPLAYSSILSGEYESYFPFDSQQDIFIAMFKDLDKAIEGINGMTEKEKLTLATFDSWCSADPQLWIKIANTLKLRMALRLSKREAEMNAAGVDIKAIATTAAANTLATVDKDIVIAKNLENEMWLMFAWGDCGFNANLVTLMSGMKDPRQPLYMSKNTKDVKDLNDKVVAPENTEYIGIRFAAGLPGKPNNWSNYSGWVDSENKIGIYSMPLPIFKAAESYFLLAEAKLRWGIGNQTVQDLYEEGIRVSMKNELAYRGKYAGISEYEPNAVENYINGTTTQINFVDLVDSKLNTPALNKLGVKWDEGATNEEKLERIITQKYFAVFPLSIEAWAEQRRTGYPRLFPPYVNESNGAVDSEEGIRRVIYSSNAYDTNDKGIKEGIEILNKENSSKKGISGDKGGTHVWWDNADKGNF